MIHNNSSGVSFVGSSWRFCKFHSIHTVGKFKLTVFQSLKISVLTTLDYRDCIQPWFMLFTVCLRINPTYCWGRNWFRVHWKISVISLKETGLNF